MRVFISKRGFLRGVLSARAHLGFGWKGDKFIGHQFLKGKTKFTVIVNVVYEIKRSSLKIFGFGDFRYEHLIS